jgi:hypothetical protein
MKYVLDIIALYLSSNKLLILDINNSFETKAQREYWGKIVKFDLSGTRTKI